MHQQSQPSTQESQTTGTSTWQRGSRCTGHQSCSPVFSMAVRLEHCTESTETFEQFHQRPLQSTTASNGRTERPVHHRGHDQEGQARLYAWTASDFLRSAVSKPQELRSPKVMLQGVDKKSDEKSQLVCHNFYAKKKIAQSKTEQRP